jgi:hypothetical protein
MIQKQKIGQWKEWCWKSKNEMIRVRALRDQDSDDLRVPVFNVEREKRTTAFTKRTPRIWKKLSRSNWSSRGCARSACFPFLTTSTAHFIERQLLINSFQNLGSIQFEYSLNFERVSIDFIIQILIVDLSLINKLPLHFSWGQISLVQSTSRTCRMQVGPTETWPQQDAAEDEGRIN